MVTLNWHSCKFYTRYINSIKGTWSAEEKYKERRCCLCFAAGSGKTTLLNALAGRTVLASGEVTLNGHPMTKMVRKRTCYVLQQDIFLSKLTLWETLYVSGNHL